MLNIRYGSLVAFHYFPPQRLKRRMQRTVGLSGEANVLCLFHPSLRRWVWTRRIINKSAEEKKQRGKMHFLCGTSRRKASWWSCSGSGLLPHSIKFDVRPHLWSQVPFLLLVTPCWGCICSMLYLLRAPVVTPVTSHFSHSSSPAFCKSESANSSDDASPVTHQPNACHNFECQMETCHVCY